MEGFPTINAQILLKQLWFNNQHEFNKVISEEFFWLQCVVVETADDDMTRSYQKEQKLADNHQSTQQKQKHPTKEGWMVLLLLLGTWKRKM